MRISDWSSDVCSSDLARCRRGRSLRPAARPRGRGREGRSPCSLPTCWLAPLHRPDRRRMKPSGWMSRGPPGQRSEEHTSELQSLMRISYAVFCLKKKTTCDPPHHTKRDTQTTYINSSHKSETHTPHTTN